MIKQILNKAPIKTVAPMVSLKEVLQPNLVETLNVDSEPIAVKISHNLFVGA